MILLDALDDNQPIGIVRQDGVACLLGSQPPVRTKIAIAPGCRSVDLTGQVCSDHRRIASIVLSQRDPVLEPACLGDLVGVPQRGPGIGRGIMTVENDLQTIASCTLNDPIQKRQTAESLQVRIELVVDALRFARGIEELVAEGQAKGVETSLCDLVQHLLPVTSPEAMGGEGTRLKAKPVDAYQAYLAP